MKLLRFKLNAPFRSLGAGFELQFLREPDYACRFEFHPYCLAGPNGSGKSNVLEALAAIFYHIECIYLNYRPAGFEFDPDANPAGFRAEKSTPDAFELEYFINNFALVPNVPPPTEEPPVAHILISKIVGARPEIHWLNRADFQQDAEETLLARAEVKDFLPKYALGYSSGHNEILSLPFFKMRFIHFDEYRARLTDDFDYGGPEGRLIYLDEQYSQVILLCHFLFPSKAVIDVFKDKIGLEGIRRFRLIIRRLRLHGSELSQAVSPTSQSDSVPQNLELTARLAGLIDKLVKCSTTHHEEFYGEGESEGSDLILDYWVDDQTREAFRYHFGAGAASLEQSKAASARNLFHALQTLLTLNYYQVDNDTKAELYRSDSLYVNETIPMPASHQRITRFKHFEIMKDGITAKLYGKALSDGEHQFVHTIGLCLLFRDVPTLFLLDEPETHLNPAWRASYVSTLRAALEADEAATKHVMREVLITSHSPFIISDCRPENVLVFQKDPDGNVDWRNPDFNTFGASANAITVKIFHRKATIGDYALDKLKAFRQRLESGDPPDTLIDEANKELGDSVEKVLFINQALDKLEGK